MARKGETHLQKRIHRAVRRAFKCFSFKVHGNEFQRSGIPDLLFCICGIFLGLEVKMPRGRVSEVQFAVMREIREAGGYAEVVEDPEEALRFITRVLRKEGRLSQAVKAPAEEGRRVRMRKGSLRSLVQAAPRKDLHNRRRHRKT